MAPKTASDPTRDAPFFERALLVACLLGIAYALAQILLFAYGRDQGIYAVVADSMLHGGMPYRDAWDFKPPGVYLVYVAARALLGRAEWAIRVVEVAALASMVAAFTILARRFFGDRRIGIVGGALGVLVHAQLEFWHTAQPESFGAVVVAWALVAATYEPREADPDARRKLRAAWIGAGLLYGFAGLLKPPLAGCAVVSALFASWNVAKRGGGLRARVEPVLVVGLAGTAAVGACALWFVARGAFHDLYETLFVFTPNYTKLSWEGASVPGALYLALEEFALAFSSANAVGMLAAVILPPLAAREREGVLHLLGVVFVQLVGVAMQGKYFPYHFGACLPLGGLLAGLGAWKLWQRALRRGAWAVPAYVALAWLALKGRTATRDTDTDFLDRCLVRQRWLLSAGHDKAKLDAELYSVADVSNGANHEVAALLASRLPRGARAFIWGFEPQIYDLARIQPASRYLYDVPQRVAWGRDQARARLLADLDHYPPAAIVVEHRDVFPSVTGDAIDSADTLRGFHALADRLARDYELGATIQDFDVYFAKTGPSARQ